MPGVLLHQTKYSFSTETEHNYCIPANHCAFEEKEHNYCSDLNQCTLKKSISHDHVYAHKPKASTTPQTSTNSKKKSINTHANIPDTRSNISASNTNKITCTEDIHTNQEPIPSTDPPNANNISNSDIHLHKAEINLLDATSFSTIAPNIHIHGTQYKFLDVPGDGNCFFNCLSLAFHGNISFANTYRNLICSHIVQNWDIYSELAALSHGVDVCDSNSYRQHMLHRNAWATACEINTACDIFHINITTWVKGRIFDAQSRNFQVRYTPETYSSAISAQCLNLHLANSHFSLLLPLPNNLSEASPCQRTDYLPPPSKKKTSVKQSLDSDKGSRTTFSTTNKQILKNTGDIKTKPRNSTSKDGNLTSTQTSKNNINKKRKQFHSSNSQENGPSSKKQRNKSTMKKNKRLTITQDHTYLDSENIQQLEPSELDTFQKCRRLGIKYHYPQTKESVQIKKKRRQYNKMNILSAQNHLKVNANELPQAPPVSENDQFNKTMDCIRAFELKQMAYSFSDCKICHERRIDMKMASEGICFRCHSDKSPVKMFSEENKMNPLQIPPELQNLTLVEQQLICRIAPLIHVHMLKHGGIAANGHCVTFPQNVNEPAKILPNLPSQINIIRVRKRGSKDTVKEFNVRRSAVEAALRWLKLNNPAYTDILISTDRLDLLPEDAPINIDTVETQHFTEKKDKGPAPQQTDPGKIDDHSVSCVTLPDPTVHLRSKVEEVVQEVVGENAGEVKSGKKYISIPWPTQGDMPLSEFTTKFFFTLAFPCLFPFGLGDFHINRPRTCTSMTEWAEHLMWYEDGRFAKHHYFKFIVHNIINRKRTLEQSTFIVKQQLGEIPISISDIKEKLNAGDTSIVNKILYFGACLRGTSQYWAQRNKELRSLVQYQINEGNGLPSFFTTASCAEYHFKALRRLLQDYTLLTTGKEIDLSNRNTLFTVLQQNTHIVSHYFDLRTQAYFDLVMGPAFGINAYWYRYEFAKSRGMIHWHGLCWRSDREPHNLLHKAYSRGLSEDMCAQELSDWAKECFEMTASHPAGKDNYGDSRKDLWPPPEGTAQPPADEDNPLFKLLMDVSETQETLLEDYLLLCNRVNLHRCSDYCLRKKGQERVCRMEFGTEKNPGKANRNEPAIIKDRNGSMRLEMERDHPMLVQHSRYHTQGWRANGDISLILSKSPPDNPSVDEIIATEKYVTGYACKGNEPTGAVADLFQDIVKSGDENANFDTKSACTKLLMNTVKRDVSSMEASYELLSLPLYRCSHQFQNVSLSGSRVLEKHGKTLTKSTALDKYLGRPPELNCSWYKFICSQGKVPVISGSSVRATWPLTDDYSRTMLLLHWPNWHQLEDIKPNDMPWETKFNEFLQSDDCPNFVKADVERARKKQDEIDNDNDDTTDSECDPDEERPEWMQLLEPNKQFICAEDLQFDDGGLEYDWSTTNRDYPSDFGVEWLSRVDMHQDEDIPQICLETLRSMNSDQRLAFCIVMDTLIKFKNNSEIEPLRLTVTGTAGSGKSFLINCLVDAIQNLFANKHSVQVLCPTGNSANLISGKTIHDFFKIPTGFKAKKEMSPPDGTRGEIIQDNCKHLVALIIDERSLVGSTTLGWMEYVCSYGVGNTKSTWGGIPVVVFLGDDVQLPPVCDTPVYSTAAKCPASEHGLLVWKSFQHVLDLKTIIRQNEDQQKFKDVLTSLRNYKTSNEEALWLQQFQWHNLQLKFGNELVSDMNENGLFVFPTHSAEHAHNMSKLAQANASAPVAKLLAINNGSHSKTATADKAGGLVHTLQICVGAKVMLTSNLAVQYGLFNGSMGIVKDIVYLQGRRPPETLPDVVMVAFDRYSGPPFLPDAPKLVPIVPVERRIDCFCHACKRKQIPLRLGWGTTIHRCQGMTIGRNETNRYIIIDPGSTTFESKNPGALFVALSRAKTAGNDVIQPDFAWHPNILLNEDRICHSVKTPTVTARQKEIIRLNKMALNTRKQFSSLVHTDEFERILTIVNNSRGSEE